MDRRPKILLADDDPDLLEMYQEILAQLPSRPEIHTSASGARALAMLEAEPFQLLICDLKMPKMDGLQVLAIVRRKYPQLRTVALTAELDEQFRSRAYALGVDLFWHKPATEQETKTVPRVHRVAARARDRGRLPRRAEQEPHGHHPVGVHLAEFLRAAHHQRPAQRQDLDPERRTD